MKFILITFALFISSSAYSQSVIKETAEESKVCNLVASLPEVVNADSYVKKVTKGKRHLFSYLGSSPTKDVPYYWVKVAEDNGQSYHTHFHFYVESKTYKIFYYDTATNKIIPEKKLRKKLLSDYPITKG